MSAYLNIAMIIISVALILVVLLQSQGRNFSGAFSNDQSVVRTRRGLEKTLFQATLVLAVVFILVAILSARQG